MLRFFPTTLRYFWCRRSAINTDRENTVIVAKTRTEYCPVTFLQKFMAGAELTLEDKEAYVIPRLFKTKSRHRNCFKDVIQPFFDPSANYSLHSLRSGGASLAANNKG